MNIRRADNEFWNDAANNLNLKRQYIDLISKQCRIRGYHSEGPEDSVHSGVLWSVGW